jgi:hypothetical protein
MVAMMRALIFFAALFAVGCGNNELPGGPDSGVDFKNYCPLTDGSWWKYEDLDNPGTYHNDALSGPVAIPGDAEGRSAFLLVRTHSDDPGDVHRTYLDFEGEQVLRYRKEWDKDGALDYIKIYDPGFLQLDMTQLQQGDTWKAVFVRTDYDDDGALVQVVNKAYQYTVESTNDPQTVKGQSLPCVKITRLDLMDGDTKTFWYAEGVGRVKEIGVSADTENEQQEMLVDYEVK